MTPRRDDDPKPRPLWTEAELEADRQRAIAIFRDERIREDPSRYGEAFDQRVGWFEDLLEMLLDFDPKTPTSDETIIEILSQSHLREALRYIAGPPLSEDELLILADASSFSRKVLSKDPRKARQIFATVTSVLDRHRFVWVSYQRFPPAEAERKAAVLASAALLAKERIQADRRNDANKMQEDGVLATLTAAGMTMVEARPIKLPDDAPPVGHVSRTAILKSTRADIIARLWDTRLLAIECKVTNSAVNSYKRLMKEAVGSARKWTEALGSDFIVPAVVLSGVFSLNNLIDAQRTLSIWWSHDLGKLRSWVESTRS
jgi:hypothetical protein